MNRLETYTTKRGSEAPLVNGFKFSLNRTLKETKYWKCSNVKSKCKAVCQTDVQLTQILGGLFLHNHEAPAKADMDKLQLQAICKKRCLEEPDENPQTIVIREVKRRKLVLQPHQLNSVREAIYVARAQPLPGSLSETIKMLQSDDFIPPDDDFFMAVKEEVVMFSFDRNIAYFRNTPRLFGDGTFDSRPPFCSQLYTLHVENMEHYLPLAFFLLQDKRIATYTTMLQLLIEQCEKRGVHFKPEVVHLDFEDAAHSSFKCIFPEIRIRGCNFHLKQAWLRKCQEIGLKADYENKESDIHDWIRTLFGLAFLDPNQVQTVFAFDATATAPIDPRIDILENYLAKTYCMNDSRYPPSIWASDDLGEPRTTNCCESFHAALKKKTGHRPNIFKFVRCLSFIQELTKAKMNAIDAGNPRAIPRTERLKRLRWHSFSTQYKAGVISREQYIHCMSYKFI